MQTFIRVREVTSGTENFFGACFESQHHFVEIRRRFANRYIDARERTAGGNDDEKKCGETILR
jgi:hypothetical protein